MLNQGSTGPRPLLDKEMKKTLSLSAALLMSTTPVFAQDAILLDEIVVSASSLPRERSKLGVQVETLNSADVDNQGTQIVDWLNYASGTSITSNGGAGSTSSFRLRGLSGYYTPVYVNGIELSDSRSPQSEFNWGAFGAMNITTAEVLKGSQSALYGSGAVAGVVTLSTKQPAKDNFSGEVSIGVGTYKTTSGSVTLAYKNETTEIALTQGNTVTEGFSASSKNGSTEADGMEASQTFFSAKHSFENGTTVGYDFVSNNSHVEIDGFGGDDSTPDNDYTDNKIEAHRVFASTQLNGINATVAMSKVLTDGDYVYQGEVSNSKSTRTKVEFIGTMLIDNTSDLSFGASKTIETYSSQEVPSTGGEITYAPKPVNAENSITGMFVEYSKTLNDTLTINASLRHDEHSQVGNQTTARLAGAWEVSPTMRVRSSVATGYRAPSIYELNSLYNGNSDLKVEESESFELGFEADVTNSTTIAITGFQNKVKNKIDWKTDESYNDLFYGEETLGYEEETDIFHGGYENTDEVTTIKGVEISGKSYVSTQLSLDANYTYTEAKSADGKRLLRVPAHVIKVGVNYSPTERANVKLFATRTIDRLDKNAQNAITNAKDYTLLGLNTSYQINDRLTAFANVSNLLDEEFETASGYNQAGRSIFAGIRASF